MDLKEGNIYAVNGRCLCGHFLIYVKNHLEYLWFWDTPKNSIVKLSYKDFSLALKTKAYHPVHLELHILDFVEKMPEEMFEVIKFNFEKVINEEMPYEIVPKKDILSYDYDYDRIIKKL